MRAGSGVEKARSSVLIWLWEDRFGGRNAFEIQKRVINYIGITRGRMADIMLENRAHRSILLS